MKIKMKEQGFSLVVVLVFIALLSSLAIIAVRMGGLTASSMYGEKKGKEAYYIAEAAYQYALFKLNQDPSWRGDLINQPFGNGMYSVNVSQASQTNPVDDITITAVGTVGNTEQTIIRVIPPPVKPFKIFPFAGTGTPGLSGDGGLAINARFRRLRGLAFDIVGNLYIADTNNHRIRKVDKVTKIVTTVAGTNQGFSGDGGLATNAQLNSPEGVYVNQAGNIYIADTDNCRIRKVDALAGIITTYAGTGICSSFGIGDGGLATNARLNIPRDVVVDSNGNLYIADSNNCRIRRVDASTGTITTYAGTVSCGWNGDGGTATNTRFRRLWGLAFDVAGNLYVADRNNHRIRKIDKVSNIVTTVAGTSRGFSGDGGLATNAQLNWPEGVAVNQFGTIYIADTNNHRIRKIDSSTGIISTHAGTGTFGNTGDGGLAINAQLNTPSRVLAYDDVDGHILISDTINNRIREVTNVY